MVDLRDEILRTYPTLTREQRSRPIYASDIVDAIRRFGTPLANQMTADYWSGFKAWDSFSMILQCETLLPTEEEARRFREWALGRLRLKL